MHGEPSLWYAVAGFRRPGTNMERENHYRLRPKGPPVKPRRSQRDTNRSRRICSHHINFHPNNGWGDWEAGGWGEGSLQGYLFALRVRGKRREKGIRHWREISGSSVCVCLCVCICVCECCIEKELNESAVEAVCFQLFPVRLTDLRTHRGWSGSEELAMKMIMLI